MYLGIVMLASAQEVQFTSPEEPSVVVDEGYVLLGWELADTNIVAGVEFEVQQSTLEDFSDASIRYRGTDVSTYVSGLPSGVFHYRVGAAQVDQQVKSWSAPVQVEVAYVSPRIVIILCTIGVIVFVAVLVAVIRGYREFSGGDVR